MVVGLGVALFLAIGLFWVKVAGSRTGSVVQSAVALLLQMLLGVGAYMVVGLRADEATYFFYAEQTLDKFRIDPLSVSSGFSGGKESFIWILAFLFALFGVSALPGLAMNAMFLAFLPAIFVWTGRNMGFFSSGRVTAWIVALAPPVLLWGPGLKREALVFLLLSLFLLSLSMIYAKRWRWGVALAVLVSFATLSTRSSLLAVYAAGIVAMSLLTLFKKIDSWWSCRQKSDSSLGLVVLATTVAIIPAIVAFTQSALTSPTSRDLGRGIPELSDTSQATALVDASWDANSTFPGFTYNLVRSLFGPMPWEVTNPSLLIFWIEGVGYLIFFSVIAVNIFRHPRFRGRILVLLATVAPLVAASALILANYGLNSRIRAHIFLILILAVEPYVSMKLKPRKRSRAVNFSDDSNRFGQILR